MKPASGRQTCDCYKDRSNQEFRKIVELEDVGAAIYRYSPQTQDEAQISYESGEVFILRNSGVDLKIEEFKELAEPGKKTISCPRCKNMIERAKKMFENLPPAKTRQVTGVCSHCYQKVFFHCPCCDKIVDRFLKFCLEEQHKTEEQRKLNKSWVTKTEVSFKKSVLNIRDGKLEPRTRLEDRVQEFQAPVSRCIPAMKQETGLSEISEKTKFKRESERIQEQNQDKIADAIMERPLRVISFLDFSEEQKLIITDEPDKKKKIRLVEENIEKSLKSVSFHAYSRTTLKPKLMTAEDIKSTHMSEKYLQSSLKLEKDSRSTPLTEKDIESNSTMEKDCKRIQITGNESRPKSIMKKKSAIKPEGDDVPKDYITPRGERQRPGSPTTRLSFDTVMKSLSEQNVSVFRYTFPHDKQSEKEIKSVVSSSELIINTQNMIAERANLAKRMKQKQIEHDEIRKIREEEKKYRITENKWLSEEEKRKQKEEERDIKTGEIIGEQSNKTARRKREDDMEVTHQEGKPHTEDGLEKDYKRQKQDPIVQQEKDSALRGKGAQEADKVGDAIQKELTTEKKTQRQMEAMSDSKDKLQKGENRQNLDIDQDKTKAREGKQRNLGAEAALQEQVAKQAKQKSEGGNQRYLGEAMSDSKDKLQKGEKRQNLDIDQDKIKSREDKQRNLGAEAALQEQVAKQAKQKSEGGNQRYLGEAMSDSKDKLQKGKKQQNLDIDQDKTKTREGKQRNLGAEAALQEQIAKQSKEKSEEEKLRKQDKDSALREKRAEEAEKEVGNTQKHLTTENKQQREIKAMSDSKDKLQKGDKPQKKDIDQVKTKEKEGKQREPGAEAALKEHEAKQAREVSDEEKLRKQKDKDAALIEKKAQEAGKAIEATQKQLTVQKKTKPEMEAMSNSKDELLKGDMRQKVDADKGITKVKEGKQRDLGAESALKEQVAKQTKDKLEQEKVRKQEEKDAVLREKKAHEAEKAIEATQKQLTTEKNINRKSISGVAGDRTDVDKGHTRNDENLANSTKEEKVKGGKNDNMMAVLREQLAKQKQQELEKDRIKKQQQKEKELAEKRLQELERKKEAEKSAIKVPVLEIKDEVSVDENLTEVILKPDEVTDIIIGQKLFKVKSAKKYEDPDSIQAQKPKQSTKQITSKQESQFHKYFKPPAEGFTMEKPGQPVLLSVTTTGDKKSKASDTDVAKGVIKYTLSDRTFIDKGWTMLPTEKVVRKVIIPRRTTHYIVLISTPWSATSCHGLLTVEPSGVHFTLDFMQPAKPEFDWFKHNKSKRGMTYDTGEKLAEFDDNGRGRWYYRSGELALDYYDAEETNAGQRFVVYSTGLPDERGRCRPRTLLATFDYSGNGIVFDHTGKIRLKYNQTEGVVLDRTIGPVSHWKWHTLNDPPVLQQVMIDTQMPYKDPTILGMEGTPADAKRPDDEEMLAIEFENFLKEKRQKTTQSFKPFQIRMKALKINEYFSLRVLDQASIYLLFRDGTTNLKLNIGMVLDHKEIVDTDTAEICEVSNTLDKLPACTDSIAELQKAVAKAQAQERLRLRHELRLKPPQATASIDALRAGCSRPLRTPVTAARASITSCDKMTPKRFKPSSSGNLYYSNQLF